MTVSKNIVVIDYGMGNLASVYNALKFLGEKPKISDSPKAVIKADKIVLPGVGAFGGTMAGLEKRALTEAIKEAIAAGKVYLGICLGLQILFEGSEEGNAKGLGIFKGGVKRFREKNGIKVPHIGWNSVKLKAESPYFYFDHSYYAEPEDKSIVTGTTDYGISFPSMINKGNIYGVQFHPERSQAVGLELLKKFISL